jgi:tRNA A-37 threonylcarbamoyl transferase component Bud32
MSAGLAASDKLLGQVLAERYHVLHRLGEGAMGVVYKARHVRVGRMFAVKVLHPRMLADPKVVRRFEREAELAGRLHHPNVIGVVDVGEVGGTRYMVMDFAEGPDLAKLLDEAPMTPERIIGLVRPMLEGLYHAHEQGLIHRDFKPENVIIERDSHGVEVPRIVDFGIALLRDGGDSVDGAGRLTTNGLVLGTPHYMAPEQAVADPIDHRIDLFALGIVVYEMLSGRLPFDGSGAEVARANLLIDPPPIRQRVKHLEVDPLLEAFARRLMAKKRTARPATAKAARELLDLIEHDRGAAAAQLGVPAARSGRAAPTESVAALDDPTDVLDVHGATVRMQPTPRPVAPVAVPHALPTGPSQRVRRARFAQGEIGGGDPAGVDGEPVAPDGERVDIDLEAVSPAWAEPYAPPDLATELRPGAAHGGFAQASSNPPAMAYAVALAAPPAAGYGLPRRPHRDTALRTPMGWQTASLPGRRRSWLIAGVVVGALSIVTAAVLTLTGDGEPSSHAQAVNPGTTAASPVAAAAPRSPAPARVAPASASKPPGPNGDSGSPIDEPRPGRAAGEDRVAEPPAAAPAAPAPADHHPPGTPVRDPRGDGRRPTAAAIRRDRSPEAASRPDHDAAAPDAAPRRVRDRAPEVREPDVATLARPDAAVPAARSAKPAPSRADERSETVGAGGPAGGGAGGRSPRGIDERSETAGAGGSAGGAGGKAPRGIDAPPTGISAAELGELYAAVKAEIEQLPEASRQDLLNELVMLDILRALTGSQEARDDAAAQLRRLRQQMHDRKTGR